MKAITNNQGKVIHVSETIFAQLKNSFKSGFWCAIIKDVNNNVHSVILNQTF